MQSVIKNFKKGELIIKKGDAATEMFFILDGKVQIINDDGKVLDMISKGGFFGEIGLLKQVARTASVRAGSSVCDVLVLSKDAIQVLLSQYPDSFQVIALESEKRSLKVEERNVSESLMSSSELGKFVAKPSSHTANEFTDGIKVNRRERMSLSRMFKSKDSSSGSRQLPTIESSAIPKEVSSTSLDSIRDPEPKKGMVLHTGKKSISTPTSPVEAATVPETIQPHSGIVASDSKADKPKNTIGKLFSSLRTSLSKTLSKSSNRIMSIKNLRKSDEDITTSSVEHILDLLDSDMPIIFSLVDPLDLIKLQRVCRRWANLIKQGSLWRSLDLHTHFRIVNKDTLSIFTQLANSNLQKLDVSGCWEVSDDDLKSVATTCPNLMFLSVSNCWKISDAGIGYIAKDCRNLKELDLSYCGQLSCSTLINHCWTNLEKFNFSFCKQLGDEHLESILSKTTKIKSLEFRRCNRVTDFGLFLVVRYCR